MGRKSAPTQAVRYEILNCSTVSALDGAKDFLRQVLADGPVPATEVRRLAEEAGITPRTLERAKQQLAIKVARRGIPGRRGGGEWAWRLDSGENANDAEAVLQAPRQHGTPSFGLHLLVSRASREFRREVKRLNSVIQMLTPFARGRPSRADYKKVREHEPLSGPYALSAWEAACEHRAVVETTELIGTSEEGKQGTYSTTLALPVPLPDQPDLVLLRVLGLNSVVASGLAASGRVLGGFLLHSLEQIPTAEAEGKWKFRQREHQGWLAISADPDPSRRVTRALSHLRDGASLPFTREAVEPSLVADERTAAGAAARLEGKWYEEANSRFRWCRYGSHLYLAADYHEQRDCLEHQDAIRQKRFRLTRKLRDSRDRHRQA